MDLDAIDVVVIESENSGDEKNVDSKSILNDQSDKDLEDNEGEKNEEIKTAEVNHEQLEEEFCDWIVKSLSCVSCITCTNCPERFGKHCCSLCKWDLDINLNATNQNTNPSQPVANKRDESLSQDKETIKNLENKIEKMKKMQQVKHNECIRLKTKIGELSELEGQLSTVKTDNARLQTDLLECQKQNVDHKTEVNRLELELTKAASELIRQSMKTQDLEETLESCRTELNQISKQRKDLSRAFDETDDQQRLEMKKLHETLQKSEYEKAELDCQIRLLHGELQAAIAREHQALRDNALLQQKLTALENQSK
ncbi:fibrinogen- and Ig-binding protein-like isoform X2 [Anopheles gambiae]|uniref:fibrinogen- and Ig-binding protein-like isoform X2 n=1 Tax=Anopheles gambiae TaxID=7165 RepID=UPI002AC927D0|nr:fibrinogen- and Ig-binding protein-like isoform X2 [Anopheles gambiae]